jgi:hypothetical protein
MPHKLSTDVSTTRLLRKRDGNILRRTQVNQGIISEATKLPFVAASENRLSYAVRQLSPTPNADSAPMVFSWY